MRCEDCRRERVGDESGWVRVLYTRTVGGDGDEPVLIFCPRCAEQFEPGEDVLPLDAYDAPEAESEA